jgi:hypothetical protein
VKNHTVLICGVFTNPVGTSAPGFRESIK